MGVSAIYYLLLNQFLFTSVLLGLFILITLGLRWLRSPSQLKKDEFEDCCS